MKIDPADYPNLTIDGPITAKPAITPCKVDYDDLLLIVGPTGAGKSTFIEALAQDPSLRISSNRLEGFTQTIDTYSLINVKYYSQQIFLADVPGFVDTRISTTNIVSMLKEWMRESKAIDLGRILFFTPIHSARLSGSHREVLRTFQAFTGAKTAGNITIVTTLWDNLWGDGAKKRAESNFNQLRDTVWKEFIDEGSQIVKFHNTQESALSVLNAACREFVTVAFGLEIQFTGENQLKYAPFANHLTHDLQIRIQNLEIEMAHTKLGLKGALERGDDRLTSTLIPKLRETETLLAKFKAELYDNFGIVSPPLSDVPATIDEPSNIDAPVVTPQPAEAVVTHAALLPSTQSPTSALETTLQSPLLLQSPHSSSHHPKATVPPVKKPVNNPLGVAQSSAGTTSQVHTTTQIDPTSYINQVEHHVLEPISPERTFITRIIRSAKCCGDAVAHHHDA